jgi:membrane-anchored protein YejM (alkaline phosphatase superfamily)
LFFAVLPASFLGFRLAGTVKPGPNVVIITIDTLRADHLGCYGYKRIRTPNIDALASSGVRFERAYTPDDELTGHLLRSPHLCPTAG